MHVLDRLADTPVLTIDPIGQVLHQTPSTAFLFGDMTHQIGWERGGYYRWFTSPAERRHFCPSEHVLIGTEIAADLHHCLDGDKPSRVAVDLVTMLLDESAEFSGIWSQTTSATETLASRQACVVHSELGHVELHREVLADIESGLRLVIYLSTPGTAGHSKLQLVPVIGHQTRGARHLALELDRAMATYLREQLPFVEVVHADARDLGAVLAARDISEVTAVVSGLPWSLFNPVLQERILR